MKTHFHVLKTNSCSLYRTNCVYCCEQLWFDARRYNSCFKKGPSHANNSCFEKSVGNLNENGSRQPEHETPTPVPVPDPVEGAAGVSTKTNSLDDFPVRPDVRLEDPRKTLGGGHGRLLLPLNEHESGANAASTLDDPDRQLRESATPSRGLF